MALCEAMVAECREGQTALLCKCAYRFRLSDKANGHDIFLNWNNGTSHYFIVTSCSSLLLWFPLPAGTVVFISIFFLHCCVEK